MTPTNNRGKGPIFVTNADGDKGYAIAQQMLQFPTKYPHLPRYPVYAGLPDDSTERAQSLASQGAQLRAFDIFNDPAAAVNALRDVAKLCLIVDPLSERISRANAFEYGKAFIDAAKEAQVEHIIFLTPFSPLDPVSPPSSPVADPAACVSLNDPTTYRSQYMLIETYLRSIFDTKRITILRYPGILYQHLKVFRKYIMENNAFPLSNQHLEFTVESSSMLDIAHATACIAHSPTLRHSSNVYKLTGPQLLTLEEVSARVLTGLRRDIAVNFMDIEALKNILTESVGNAEHVAFLLEVWGLQQKLGGSRFEITRDLEALTGQSGKTLNEYFEDDKVQEFFQSSLPSPFVA